VSEAKQIPADLARLADGRLLLTYGTRVADQRGVLGKLSSDEGKTWSAPIRLADSLSSRDCGYPSSIQRPDGKIVTAYYSAGVGDHTRYHMGVVIWTPPSTPTP
jgi:Neuraminidase (sialidase)